MTRDDQHGPTPREQLILDRSDKGVPVQQIAEELGLEPNYVRDRISRLSMSDSSGDAFRDMIRRGTVALGARIAQVHGVRA